MAGSSGAPFGADMTADGGFTNASLVSTSIDLDGPMPPTPAITQDNKWDGVERRRAARKLMKQTVLLALPGQMAYQPCMLHDLTALGADLNLDGVTLMPTDFALSFDGFQTSFACRLAWRDRGRCGAEFRA